MPLTAGTKLGPYEIRDQIGAGGMGEVYRATDTRLDRTVAIKVLPEHLADDPQRRERFEREARAVSSLNHPHICTLHDVGEQDGTHFLVMEYVEGETLQKRLEKGRLPFDQALEFAIQIADALDKAHRKGVVHRDLKPGNIMVTKAGVKLLDFGLAKLKGDAGPAAAFSQMPTQDDDKPLTAEGTILGTLQYMAPEQLEGKEADARTDIFAFGAVVYEMVTGKRAFEGKSQASLIGAIMNSEPQSMAELQEMTPRALDHVVRKCLAKDADRRWQTAQDLGDELKWTAESEARPRDAAIVSERHRGRERLAWLLIGGAALLIAILAVPVIRSMRGNASAPLVTRLDAATPPTTSLASFALSPDGRQLAFVADGQDGSQLWVRAFDQATARSLEGTEGATFPFWAPDGGAVGFFRWAGEARRCWRRAANGDRRCRLRARRVVEPDGVIVFTPAGTGGLMQVDAAGGTPTPVTAVAAGQTSHRWPQFLPDGRRFLFQALAVTSGAEGVYLGSLDGGEAVRVLTGDSHAAYTAPGYLLIVSQATLLAYPFDVERAMVNGDPLTVAEPVGFQANGLGAFSVSGTAVLAYRSRGESLRQLVWFDRAGNPTGTLGAADAASLAEPAIAPDGGRVAISRWVQGNVDIWLVDAARGLTRSTFDTAIDMVPVWSPDGDRIAFTSNRNGTDDLFLKSASAGGDEQALLVTPRNTNPRDWSPDGRFLLYTEEGETTAADLWALPLDGEPAPMPVAQSQFDEAQGQFSPDGRWIAYASNETGRYEIWVQPFPATGTRWQVSLDGGSFPRWQHDGSELFFIHPDNTLMAVPIRAGSEANAFDYQAPEALFATQLVTAGTNIFPGGPYSTAQYAVGADGAFLINVDIVDTSPINIVLNWPAGLEP